MKTRMCYGILVLFMFATKWSFCVEKYWLPDLEWRTAKNWVDDRMPEIDSHVVFPLQTRHAVGMANSGDFRLAGIDLARSGSLILPRDGNLQLSEPGKSPPKISRWVREGHFFWADPGNWNGTSVAAPHLEQVPCRQDDIVLPQRDRAFSVLLPMKSIEVRSIRTSGEKRPLTSWQWTDLESRREFDRGISTVKYAEYSCGKCPCQNDPNGYYLEEICGISRPRCGFTSCEFPLRVEGHCCQYCGGRLSLSSEASLPMVRAAAGEALEGYADRIAWHVRRKWDGSAEVLIKEKGDYAGIDILEAVENMKKTLLSMKIQVLSTETTGAALKDHRLVAIFVPLLGTPLIILGLIFLGFMSVGYSSRQILSSFTEIFLSIRDGIRVDKGQRVKSFGFARFENIPEGNVQIAEPVSVQKAASDVDSSGEATSGGRFENPLYRSKRKHGEEKDILDMGAALSLSTLRDKVEDRMEEMEVDIDQ